MYCHVYVMSLAKTQKKSEKIMLLPPVRSTECFNQLPCNLMMSTLFMEAVQCPSPGLQQERHRGDPAGPEHICLGHGGLQHEC